MLHYHCECIEARTVLCVLTITTASHRVLSWWVLSRMGRLCMYALLQVLSLFFSSSPSIILLVVLVSDKQRTPDIVVIHSSQPFNAKIFLPSSLCVSCCVHVRITSWACGVHGQKSRIRLQGIFSASRHDFVISNELQLDYESTMVVAVIYFCCISLSSFYIHPH